MTFSHNNSVNDALNNKKESLSKFISKLDDGFELLELIYNNQGNIVDFVFVEVNPAFEKQTGLKAVNIIGKRKKEVAPASEQRWYDYAIKAAKTGKTISYEYYNDKVNGYFDTRFIPISTNQIAVVFKDVTQRKKTEEALLQSEIKFRTIANFTDDWETWISPEGMFIYVSPSCERITGFKPEEFIKDTELIIKITHPDDKALIESHYKSIVSKQLPNFDYKIITKSGEVRWIAHACQRVFDDKGKWLGRRGSNRDITEHKKAEEALKESEEKYRALIEATNTGYLIIDKEGRVIDANQEYVRLTGHRKLSEIVGRSVIEWTTDYEKERNAESIRQCFRDGFIKDLVIDYIDKNGHITPIEISAAAIGAGETTQVIALCRDITERKKFEKQLWDNQRMAAIGQTAGMVGHDIRNPLQAIAGDLFLIDNDVASLPGGETKECLQESVKSIQDNLLYIAKIVEDLQDYAKTLKPNFERVRIDKVIEDVMLLMGNVALNYRVIIDVEEGFPEIVSDFSMLKRVLANLTQNAIQAMPDGGQLTLRANHKGSRVLISVEDTGEGIPEEVKLKLFNPMVTTKSKGQGLGLAVVKRLIEALNGTVTFESELGQGTKFIIELPAQS